jgi:hypothetical protein
VLRVADGDDSTCLTLLCAHAAASERCVGSDVVPPGSGANADVAATSGLHETELNYAGKSGGSADPQRPLGVGVGGSVATAVGMGVRSDYSICWLAGNRFLRWRSARSHRLSTRNRG